MKPVCWKRMSSGKYIDLNNLKEEDLDIQDVLTALSMTYRFNGHCKDERPLTVAEHSWLCYAMAEDNDEPIEVQLGCFIHDFAEAYIGDVSSPMKKAMGQIYYDFARPIEHLVECKFFGGPMPPEVKERVKLYDLASLDIERRVMWSSQVGKDKWPPCPLDMGTMENKENWYWTATDAANNQAEMEQLWVDLYESLYAKQ